MVIPHRPGAAVQCRIPQATTFDSLSVSTRTVMLSLDATQIVSLVSQAVSLAVTGS